MKFCGKCGMQMEDDVKFCPTCGEPQQTDMDPIAAVKNHLIKNKKQLALIAGIAVCAVLALILLISLFTPGYKKAAKKFFNAMEKHRLDKMIDCMPGFLSEDLDKSDIKEMQSNYKETMSGIKISYTISNTEKLDKDEIKSLESRIQNDVSIKKAYRIYVKLTTRQEGEKNTQTVSVYSIKIGSKWYIYSREFGL